MLDYYFFKTSFKWIYKNSFHIHIDHIYVFAQKLPIVRNKYINIHNRAGRENEPINIHFNMYCGFEAHKLLFVPPTLLPS